MKRIITTAMTVICAILPCAGETQISIDPAITFQRIDNFTASDAWSGNFVGQYFDERQKEQIAKWLFSQKIGNDGNPEGIGLSLWRVNVGAGTLEQDGADIEPFQRRAESFLTKDGKSYDWGKCSGQQWFMREAKKLGCKKFLLFSNTPPVQWTLNGKGYKGISKTNRANIKPDCYGKFGDFLAEVARHFVDGGFDIAYISPVNEPQWIWNKNAQEGTPWYASEIRKTCVELDRALAEKKLDSVKILIGECDSILVVNGTKDYQGKDVWAKKTWKNDPVEERPDFVAKKFYDPQSPLCLTNLKHMPKILGTHAYHMERNSKMLADTRLAAKAEADKYGIELQQTEWCMLPNFGPKTHDGFTNDWYSDNKADIQAAILMSRIIYADIGIGNMTAWGYWKGMEIKGDHALIGVYPTNGDLAKGGVARDNKLLWALGNYSLFVRPDYKRVRLDGAEDMDKTCALAFVSPDAKRIVAVFTNSAFEPDTVKISLPDAFKTRVEKTRAFRTDANMNLGNLWIDSAEKITLAPRSITTVVFDLK